MVTLTSQKYFERLDNQIVSVLEEGELSNILFQQDRASSHYTLNVRDF